MYKRLIDRFGAKALAIGVVVALLGGGAALALPDEAIEGMSEAADNREAAALNREDPTADTGEDEPLEEDSSDPVVAEPQVEGTAENEEEDSESDDRRGPPEEVREFLGELHTWIACIQEGARAHADQQSNPDTRVEDDEYDKADKLTLCGDKPTNPNDSEQEAENEEDEASENNSEDGDRGRPEDAGPPDWAGGPPDWAGPPEGAGGPPPGAGGPGR